MLCSTLLDNPCLLFEKDGTASEAIRSPYKALSIMPSATVRVLDAIFRKGAGAKIVLQERMWVEINIKKRLGQKEMEKGET